MPLEGKETPEGNIAVEGKKETRASNLADGMSSVEAFTEKGDINQFLQNIKRVGAHFNWSPETKLTVLLAKVSQAVFFYIRTNPSTRDSNDYGKICQALCDRYDRQGPAKTWQAKRDFDNCKQKNGESAFEYAQRLRETGWKTIPVDASGGLEANKVAMIESCLLEKFRDGMFPRYSKYLWLSSPKTLEEAIELAERMEAAENIPQRQGAIEAITDENLSINKHTPQVYPSARPPPVQGPSAPRYNNGWGNPNNNRATYNRQSYSRNIICYFCENPGHIQRECRLFIKMNPRGPAGGVNRQYNRPTQRQITNWQPTQETRVGNPTENSNRGNYNSRGLYNQTVRQTALQPNANVTEVWQDPDNTHVNNAEVEVMDRERLDRFIAERERFVEELQLGDTTVGHLENHLN